VNFDRDLSLVVPAYNEEQALVTLLPEALEFCERHNFTLIVTNDGSRDGTGDVLARFAQHPNLVVVKHKVNRGYGGAIKSGVMAATSRYVITIDADGQHRLEDVLRLYELMRSRDADMIVGRRVATSRESLYRGIGKALLRTVARMLMPLHIRDLNSGMKIYDSNLGKRYLRLCPNSMAYSDVITLVFISQRHLVLEEPITVVPRTTGKSTISTRTAFETLKEILNVVVLFNPMRVFLPISIVLVLLGVGWGVPIVLRGNGISTAATLLILAGLIFFFLGLMAEQLSMIRKNPP
jgi:glycosyltransferase involved in cell wall biosynthesis